MPLETIELHPAAPARASLIVLHGLGADGADFVPVCDALALDDLGPVRCILPRAPVRPVTINGGYRMRAWYDILGGEIDASGGRRHEDEAGLRQSMAEVHALIDRERERGVSPGRIVLAGFSQGCAMTLLAGLRYPSRLAGLAGLSGYLPLAARTADERHAANHQVPIFLAHGTRDDVVAPERGRAGHEALAALGCAVQWHEYPMGHELCLEEVQALSAWLRQALG